MRRFVGTPVAFGRVEGDFFSTFVRGLTPTAKTNAALRARVFAA